MGKTVRTHYRGTFNDGTQFDASYDRGEPLEFVCGAGMMISGFDSAVADMEVGEHRDIHLLPSEAYGEPDPGMIFPVEIAQLPGAENLTVGQKVYLYNTAGQPCLVKVVAKDDETHRALSEKMSRHDILREYHAVVYGNLKEDSGFVEASIGRDKNDRKKMAVTDQNAKYAYTEWRVLERFGNFTYIACRLKTGRTHQIRVHMASIGHPLAGDPVYGPRSCITELHGQCLHAKMLGFEHPATGQWMEFDSDLPPYFEKYLQKLRKGRG